MYICFVLFFFFFGWNACTFICERQRSKKKKLREYHELALDWRVALKMKLYGNISVNLNKWKNRNKNEIEIILFEAIYSRSLEANQIWHLRFRGSKIRSFCPQLWRPCISNIYHQLSFHKPHQLTSFLLPGNVIAVGKLLADWQLSLNLLR